jgi:hypothetical protein
MAFVVPFVLAALVGAVGYYEFTRIERQRGSRLLGLSAIAWVVVACIAGLVIAYLAAPIVLATLTGYVGYREALRYKEHCREDPLGIAPMLWLVAATIFGLGSLFAPLLLWLSICTIVALAGAVLCEREEKHLLTQERDMCAVENRRLLAERQLRPPEPAPPTTAGPTRITPPAQTWGSAPTTQPTPRSRHDFPGDFLPRR